MLAIAALATLHRPALVPTLGHVVLHPACSSSSVLMAHGYLASARPHPARLTEFYLWVAIGGVLGGTFNALVAPQVFARIIGFPLVIALSAFVLPLSYGSAARRHSSTWRWDLAWGLFALAMSAVAQRTMPYGSRHRGDHGASDRGVPHVPRSVAEVRHGDRRPSC